MFHYVASPYSHPEAVVRVQRFMLAQNFCIWAFKHKLAVFSPIVHWHHIATTYDLPSDAESFKSQNDPILRSADRMVVLAIEGWKDSKGVQYEINFASEYDIPCVLYTPYNHGAFWMPSELK